LPYQLRLFGQKIAGSIDKFNDRFTSYRLVLYFLLALVSWSIIGSFFNRLPYSWNEILVSAAFLFGTCWVVNEVVARFLNIPANKESPFITGLILALILSPPKTSREFALIAAVAVAAIVSKFVITLYKSHIFNPAAFGAFIAGELFHKYPSWWVGTKFMTPIIVIGAVLVLRKMRRFTMVGVFLAVYLLYQIYGTNSGGDLHFLWLELISTPVLFFATIMLTEPLTSPYQARQYIPYAVLVGLLYSVTKLKISPEEALLIGNLFVFLAARNRRYDLKFIRRVKEAEDIYSYVFTMPQGLNFAPGQYMEWTIAQNKSDLRGNRRYFTMSSSPTEPTMMFTIKEPKNASSYKQELAQFSPGKTMLASHVAGSFTLPKDQTKKLAFLAGGVGITPFRSMIKYLIDQGQKRDIALLYLVTDPAELSFKDLFKQAVQFGLKTIYATGKMGAQKIQSLLPDYKQRTFYISGPYGFVQGLHVALLKLEVPSSQIITDYFPGYG
jgi:ferredoxin-NADP reductase/Na+-translocating ferredoxin:NAD+ oxidoreductase RnfD subunit